MARPTHTTHFIVQNAVGTSHDRCRCGCGSWLAHWRNHTRSRRVSCSRLACSNQVEVGAHVTFTDRRRTRSIYIVGLCRACNLHLNDADMVIDSRTALALAERMAGCG